MNRPLRVLVVDDSVVFRRVVSDVISADPELQLAGTAPNGNIALQKVAQLNPDVITLDLEMPELDGMGVLRRLKATHPHIRVIVFSVHSERGAAQTLEAMALGAADFLPKGADLGSVAANTAYIKDELIAKIKQFKVHVPAPQAVIRPTWRDSNKRVQRQIVAIGVSTGGPNALATLLPMLPKDIPVPIVIVQHMPPMFTRLLAERLDADSEISVVEAEAGMLLTPGTAYIAPGNYHLTVKRMGGQVFTALDQRPQENSCRPAVDVLFRSVAEVYGQAALGAILTGMGRDGLLGVQELRRHKARIIAQDKESSVVWGMPGVVVEAGLADVVVPIQNVAAEVERCLSSAIAR